MFKYGIILAAGNGSRMLPLTEYVPKPLIKYNGVELISNGINFLKKNSVSNIIITYGYMSDKLISFVEKKVDCMINTTNQDNAYFLFNSMVKYIDDAIILMPCDIIFDIDIDMLYREYFDLNSPPILIVPVKSEVEIDSDFLTIGDYNNVDNIGRVSKHSGNMYASGIQIINPKKINDIIQPHQNFYGVWKELIYKKEVKISNIYLKNWISIDSFKEINI